MPFLLFFPIFPMLFSSSAPSRFPPSTFSELARSLARPALCLCSRFISFFRHPLLRHVRTHVLPVSLSLFLFLPLFPVPTTKNVANVRIDRSLSRALPPFFTLLPSASPLLYLPLLLSLLRLLLRLLLFTSSPSPPPLSTLPSDLLYHIRHQHYTRALISSVGNSAFLAISLLLCHPLTPSPTLSPPAPSPPRATPRFLRLPIPTSPAHRIVYALRSSTRLGYGCLISLCHTQGARIRRQFLEVNFAAIECLDSRDRDENRNCVHGYE